MSRNYTPEQKNVIFFPTDGAPMQNLLVSASAGTGKTTVMIERIARLIKQDVDVDQIVVVTFTNLAAAEMKNRLSVELAKSGSNERVREQLEKLDNASICTLHSFCSDLLRNYFYVVDIDPAFSILDTITVSNLKKQAIDELFKEYLQSNDQDFQHLYKIYSTHRREENFKNLVLSLHAFSRNIVDFEDWYQQMRQTYLQHDNGGILMTTLIQHLKSTVCYYAEQIQQIIHRCDEEKMPNGTPDAGVEQIAQVCKKTLQTLHGVDWADPQSAFDGVRRCEMESLVAKNRKTYIATNDPVIGEKMRKDYKKIVEKLQNLFEGYQKLLRSNDIDTMWAELDKTLPLSDKLVEMVLRFENKFWALKKQRGGVDFNDLEHLTLQALDDEVVANALGERYKYVFVDEYQDTNPVQEEIVTRLAPPDHLFMVGDIKQSIYGFRGCDPSFFNQKLHDYTQGSGGKTEKLNDNFRSNKDILDFVNLVFNEIMTEDLGKVDYKVSAQLKGSKKPILPNVPSVRINFLKKADNAPAEIDDYYDIALPTEMATDALQPKAIAERIKNYVGTKYTITKKNESTQQDETVEKEIGYGDIVILMRSMTARATDIYNALIAENIPVTASFKLDGLASKEVREIVNLLRVVDNPYNEVYLAGTCLSCFGGFTETELAQIRLNTTKDVVPFYHRLVEYANAKTDHVSAKTAKFLNFVDQLRFYSYGASVCDVVLEIVKQTNYDLYVQGLPNGALRLGKLNAFVDGLRGATYAESISKFLLYIDETDESKSELPLAQSNAVRIMTMHASKGLEFPIVILGGLEQEFKFDNSNDLNYVERSSEMGLATYLYDFDSMGRYETLATYACILHNKHKQREEEMRLLYVAMTRAEYVLDIFATVDAGVLDDVAPATRNANSSLDWLLYALKKNYPDLHCSNDSLVIEVVDEVKNQGETTDDLVCEQSTDAQSILDQLNYVYPFADQTAMPTKIVSSALDKQYFDDEESHAAPVLVQDDKNKIGTAYHAVYQFVDYNADVEQIKGTIKQLVESGKLEEQYANQLDVNLIYQTLQNPQLKAILAGGKVYHEIPFMLYAPYDQLAKDKRFSDKVMLQGVIDLLVIGKDKATVVDFKFTSRSDKVADRYPYQLNSYKLAVKHICGIDNVDAFVLSIADNKLIQM